jgi:hypothetical protein
MAAVSDYKILYELQKIENEVKIERKSIIINNKKCSLICTYVHLLL